MRKYAVRATRIAFARSEVVKKNAMMEEWDFYHYSWEFRCDEMG